MLLTFNAPEGAPYLGEQLPGVTLEGAAIEDIADFQRATGYKMAQLTQAAEDADVLAMQMLFFFTLRGAGHKVSWAKVGRLRIGDVEVTPEDGELDDAEAEVDPTTATRPSPEVAASKPRTKSTKAPQQ